MCCHQEPPVFWWNHSLGHNKIQDAWDHTMYEIVYCLDDKGRVCRIRPGNKTGPEKMLTGQSSKFSLLLLLLTLQTLHHLNITICLKERKMIQICPKRKVKCSVIMVNIHSQLPAIQNFWSEEPPAIQPVSQPPHFENPQPQSPAYNVWLDEPSATI